MKVTLTDARSLAALHRCERERREWLAMFGPSFRVGSPGYVAAMKSYDEAASAVVTQGLCDAVVKELLNVL